MVLDKEVVQSLHELGRLSVGGVEQIRALLRTFIREARVRAQRIADAIAASETEDVRLTAHSLAGSSGVIGAVHVAKLSRTIELGVVDGAAASTLAETADLLSLALADAVTELEHEFNLVEA